MYDAFREAGSGNRRTTSSLPSRAWLMRPAAAWRRVALAWLRFRSVPVIPIIGARKLSQFEDNLASLDLTLSADQLKTLDEATGLSSDSLMTFLQGVRPRHLLRRSARPRSWHKCHCEFRFILVHYSPMLDKSKNELFTQVGPGTPMGELLRRYWMPIAARDRIRESEHQAHSSFGRGSDSLQGSERHIRTGGSSLPAPPRRHVLRLRRAVRAALQLSRLAV